MDMVLGFFVLNKISPAQFLFQLGRDLVPNVTERPAGKVQGPNVHRKAVMVQ